MQPQRSPTPQPNWRYEMLPCTVRRYHRRSVFHLKILLFSSTIVPCIFPPIRAVLRPCCGVLSTIYSSKEGRGAINILAGIAGQGRTGLMLFLLVLLGGPFGHPSFDQIDHSIILPYRGR